MIIEKKSKCGDVSVSVSLQLADKSEMSATEIKELFDVLIEEKRLMGNAHQESKDSHNER
jgi:hypothetical protein